MGWFSQGKEMLALICSRNHIREFLPPFQWAPSPMFFPASTVNYSWTVLGRSVTKAEKAKKKVLDSILYSIFHNTLQNIIFHVDRIMTARAFFWTRPCPLSMCKTTWVIKAPHREQSTTSTVLTFKILHPRVRPHRASSHKGKACALARCLSFPAGGGLLSDLYLGLATHSRSLHYELAHCPLQVLWKAASRTRGNLSS